MQSSSQCKPAVARQEMRKFSYYRELPLMCLHTGHNARLTIAAHSVHNAQPAIKVVILYRSALALDLH